MSFYDPTKIEVLYDAACIEARCRQLGAQITAASTALTPGWRCSRWTCRLGLRVWGECAS